MDAPHLVGTMPAHLGNSHHVSAAHADRNGLRLNGSGFLVAVLFEQGQNLGAHAALRPVLDGLRHVLPFH